MDAALLAQLHDPEQLAERIEASWKSRIGVELHKHFLGLAHGHSRVKALVQCGAGDLSKAESLRGYARVADLAKMSEAVRSGNLFVYGSKRE